jgi:hypothetical protein
MALSATPAPRTRAWASRSMFSDRLLVQKLITVLVLARVALLVLSGRVSANVVCPSHDQGRVDHKRAVGRRLDVVVAGSTDGDTGTVDLRRAPGLQGSRTVLPQQESGAVRQTASDTLVVAGLIGLLGVAGAATFLADSIAGPVRRAVRVLQARAEGLDQRPPLTPRDGSLGTAADGLRPPFTASEGLAAAPGTPSSSAESPTSADVVPAAGEQVANLQAVATRNGETAPDVAESRSVLPVIARVVQQAALEAAMTAETMAATSTPAASPVATTGYAAARGRAHGPTTALWHAVELDRLVGAIGDACETTVCGSLVRVSTELRWPVAARDVCPACATLAH